MIELENFQIINKMYKESSYLPDLVHLKFEEGLHCGRWEDEGAMDESAEHYLHEMKELADKYNIEYIDDLNHYIQDEEYEAECYTMDYMAEELKEKVELELLKRIINGEEDYIQI